MANGAVFGHHVYVQYTQSTDSAVVYAVIVVSIA